MSYELSDEHCWLLCYVGVFSWNFHPRCTHQLSFVEAGVVADKMLREWRRRFRPDELED